MDGFYALFSSYWWLLFPLGFFIAAGFSSYMRYKRTQAKIDLLKTYAASGKEAPADLIAGLDGIDGGSGDSDDGDGRGTTVFLVILFGGLAAVFGAVGYLGLFGLEGPEAYFVAAILGVLAAAFLFSGIAGRGRRRD
ncbi:MAG: hypothetical protein NXI12_03710 [Alphaproteobacteria bacterium]|nr:hypothetical protein [Alphaproteobacteria bacterium]